jgi:hypothetical protein
VNTAKGEYGPFSIAVGLLITFFLLSFLAKGGAWAQRVAGIAGALVILVLAMNSADDIEEVAGFIVNVTGSTVQLTSDTGQAVALQSDTSINLTPAGGWGTDTS